MVSFALVSCAHEYQYYDESLEKGYVSDEVLLNAKLFEQGKTPQLERKNIDISDLFKPAKKPSLE